MALHLKIYGNLCALMGYETLSVVIPVYNEIETIQEIIKKVQDVDVSPLKKEIVIVDNVSTDGTREFLHKLDAKSKETNIRVFFHEKNIGKGGSLRTAFSHIVGDIVIIQDADLEYDPADYPVLLKPILSGESEVVYGSRFRGTGAFDEMRWLIPTHYFGNKFISLMASLLYFTWLTDVETCYKMFTRKALKSITLKGSHFDLDPEITAKLRRAGYKIQEVPIHFYPRTFEQGKKINWKDGFKALWILIKYRFFR